MKVVILRKFAGADKCSQEQPGAARRSKEQPGVARSSQEQPGAANWSFCRTVIHFSSQAGLELPAWIMLAARPEA